MNLTGSGGAVTEAVNYILTDHLGSIDVVTDQTGTMVATMSFDAFGQRRAGHLWTTPVGGTALATDRSLTHRGFTDQEMLDDVNLIHMNGRVYDPNLGRFLSVDPVFEFPTNMQSLNPYSYVLKEIGVKS